MLSQTEENNTKRIFTKAKSQKELMKNQKTSTDDTDELPSKTLLQKENTQTDLSLEAPVKVLPLKSNLRKKSESTKNNKKKHKRVQIVRYNLKELKTKINDINSKIDNEKTISINNYNSLNSEIKTKISKIKNLSLEQMDLISKLKIIKDQLNNKLSKVNELLLKRKEMNKKEKELQKLITVKDKEIELATKRNLKEKNEYKRIFKIFNNNDFTKENNLRKELFELKNEITKLELHIRKLGSILDQHKYCNKHKNELLHYLSLLTNAYQFEVKKTNMIDMTLNSDNETDLTNTKSINKSLDILCSPKRKFAKKIMINNKNSQPNLLSKKTHEYINSVLNNINDDQKKEIGNITNVKSFKLQKKTLFNSKENNFLEKIIPNEYLVRCKERFDNIENENNKIKEKINQNKIKRDKMLTEKQVIIGMKQIKIKAAKREELKLSLDIYKQNKIIEELKKKINEVEKETKKYKNILNSKIKENSNLKKKMNEYIAKNKEKARKGEKKEKTKRNKNSKYKDNDNDNDDNSNNDKNIIIIHQNEFKEENQKNNIIYHPK